MYLDECIVFGKVPLAMSFGLASDLNVGIKIELSSSKQHSGHVLGAIQTNQPTGADR